MKVANIALLVGAAFVSACSEVKSVEYFMAHPDEAKDVRARCLANGEAGENCGNAVVALRRNSRAEFDRQREIEASAIQNNSQRPVLKGN